MVVPFSEMVYKLYYMVVKFVHNFVYSHDAFIRLYILRRTLLVLGTPQLGGMNTWVAPQIFPLKNHLMRTGDVLLGT